MTSVSSSLSTSRERAEIEHEGVAAVLADLERLHALIGDAGETLLARFSQAQACAEALAAREDGSAPLLRASLHGAITALQFQDIAQQLIAHASNQLRQLTADESLRTTRPARNGPVEQAGMHAGTVDLF
ncbi:MAG TPA: hypothetical protein VFS42_00855 [Burkholderiaceae bacterium]|nr:hypothetical protein [Burkholderiaceae bacterium]